MRPAVAASNEHISLIFRYRMTSGKARAARNASPGEQNPTTTIRRNMVSSPFLTATKISSRTWMTASTAGSIASTTTARQPDALVDHLGLASDDQRPSRPSRRGRRPCPAPPPGSCCALRAPAPARRPRAFELGLDQGDRARRFAHRQGVDEHEHVVPVEQLIGEMHAADAEVRDLHAVGHSPLAGVVGRPRHRRRRRRRRCCRSPRRALGGRSRSRLTRRLGRLIDASASSSSSSAWK